MRLGIDGFRAGEREPYTASPAAIAAFGFWGGLMQWGLARSYARVESLAPADGAFAAVFAVTAVLFAAWLAARHRFELPLAYAGSFQFLYVAVTVSVAWWLRGAVRPHVAFDPFMLLPVEQGLIMTALAAFAGRALAPEEMRDWTRAHLEFHFANWWRLFQLGLTGIISIGVGASIAIILESDASVPIEVLLGNVFAATVPGIALVLVAVQKIRAVNSIADPHRDFGGER